LAFSGSVRVGTGSLQWRDENGEINVPVQDGQLKWSWRDTALRGELNIALEGVGKIVGHFQLPIPARLPLTVAAGWAVSGEATASVTEHGLVAALFPGTVQESRGALTLQARLAGSWERPVWDGTLALHDAAAVIPAAGVRLRDIALQARLAGDEVLIESFSAQSGKGTLSGSGRLTLQGWRAKSFSGSLKGKGFELIHLPELEATVDPDLKFSGTPQMLKVRGRILLPYVLVLGPQSGSVVTPSGDVVVVDAPSRSAPAHPFDLDVQVEVELGKEALVRINGVDARLTGKVAVQATGARQVSGSGELQVAKGTYSAYGVRLQIVRGRLLFAGGPIDQPALDILAQRTVGDVQAGVQISGTPRAPQVKLTSTPTLPDTDILSYIVLGHPITQKSSDASLLMLAAGSLLSRGQSAGLQDQIKRRLGLDVLEVQSGTTTTTTTTATVPPPIGTVTPQTNTANVPSTVVTIGKYISPDLYISLGHSLFTNTNQAGLRYTLSPRWDVESKMGSDAGGVDLYYKIEFQ
jgi:translocation and assembly module TamB